MKWLEKLQLVKTFDNSAWLVDDKKWLKERKQEWKEIQNKFGFWNEGTKEEKEIVKFSKHYFLTGELYLYTDHSRLDQSIKKPYLSLFLILWLHPSEDFKFLNKLATKLWKKFKTNLWNGLYHLDWISQGLDSYSGKSFTNSKYECFSGTGGNEADYFELIVPDNSTALFGYPENIIDLNDQSHQEQFDFSGGYSLQLLSKIDNWLRLPPKELNTDSDYIFQFPKMIFVWKNGLINTSAGKAEVNYISRKGMDNNSFSTLCIIAHFDFEQEADSKRAKMVHQLIEVFESGELPELMNEYWLKAKQHPKIPKSEYEYRQWPIKYNHDIHYDVY